MPEVYEPAEDSFLIQKHVSKFAKGKTLEIGTGSGILAIEAAKSAKNVIAVDVNPAAIAYAKKAAKEAKVKNISFKHSDLFSKLGKEQFDCIIFNPPYLPTEKNAPDVALDGGEKGHELIVKFIEGLSSHLLANGTVLLLFSSYSNPEAITTTLEDRLFDFALVDQTHVFFEDLFVYSITKSPLLKSLEKEGLQDIVRFDRGKRGVIYVGKRKGKKVAIKTAKTDLTIQNIIHEGTTLKQLNKLKIGPKLILATPEYFSYEFVEGEFILDFAEKASKKKLLAVTEDVLLQCRVLDKVGVTKFEMTHPIKHVIVQKNNVPVMIDFERCRKTDKPKNVTQFVSFIAKGPLGKLLVSKGIKIDSDRLLSLAQEYKHNLTDKSFKEIVMFF